MRLYLETSAAAKLVLEEAESHQLEAFCDTAGTKLVSTSLLETELMRIGWREHIPTDAITEVLARVSIYDLEPAACAQAGRLPQRHLRTLDALHVTAALRLNVDAILAYDKRVREAALNVGLETLSPGDAK